MICLDPLILVLEGALEEVQSGTEGTRENTAHSTRTGEQKQQTLVPNLWARVPSCRGPYLKNGR